MYCVYFTGCGSVTGINLRTHPIQESGCFLRENARPQFAKKVCKNPGSLLEKLLTSAHSLGQTLAK